MTDQENPGTVHVRLIWDDCIALLRNTGEHRISVDTKILLASVLFAYNEGITRMGPRQLRRYCGDQRRKMATTEFLQGRIDNLAEVGVLAPGSTPEELRSMIGRAAYGDAEEVAA